MIISTEVIIKPNNHSISHYLNLGYDAKYNKPLTVKTIDLTSSSNIKVDCQCDKCITIKNIKYQDYIKCISRYNFYVCEKCKFEKIKITNKEKYGNENYSNVPKRNETMKKRYNHEVPLRNILFKNKKEETCLLKYGFKNASENNEVKLKIKESHKKIFSDINKKDIIISKRKKTCLLKYGFYSYTKTKEYKNKNKKTCLLKYGYEHNGSVPKLILKRRKSRLNKINTIERTNFFLYKKEVTYYTNKVIKELYNNWDGYDYYDGEYIKDNINFKCDNGSYPSIDHKISTHYGFKNNIHPKYISDINNLCITKKSINSKKREKIYNKKLIFKLKLSIIYEKIINNKNV